MAPSTDTNETHITAAMNIVLPKDGVFDHFDKFEAAWSTKCATGLAFVGREDHGVRVRTF